MHRSRWGYHPCSYEVFLSGGAVEIAHRLARRPKPTAEEVEPLPISQEEVHRLYTEYGCK